MTYPIAEIDGLSAAAADKLKTMGIRTTTKLLEAARTVKGRDKLFNLTGISQQTWLELAHFADYMRIPGMGKGNAKLIRSTGVKTVRELGYRNPERLAQAMKASNAKHKLVGVLPSEASVKRLIDRARKLPHKISY
jgi:predicted RecB family nuclease